MHVYDFDEDMAITIMSMVDFQITQVRACINANYGTNSRAS